MIASRGGVLSSRLLSASRMIFVESFARWVADRRDDEALWSRGEGLRLSFGEVAARSQRWRGLLGAVAGRPAAVAVGNRAAFVELTLALRARDLPVIAMDAGMSHAAKVETARRLGAGAVLHRDPDGAGELLGEEVRLLTLDGPEVERPAGTALVKLTSGSTGEAVGVAFDEAGLALGVAQIAAAMSITAADRVLAAVPLSHSYGFDNGALSLLLLGTPLALEPGTFPQALLRAVVESQATVFPLVPPLARGLGQTRWPRGSALQRVICAGGLLHPETAAAFLAASGRPIHNFYGSTETGGIAFEDRPLDAAAAGTVGRPLPGVAVELGEDGRVTVVSGANRLGVVGGGRLPEPREVVTGDAGEWTPEGRLRLTGRTADILNVGGRKVPAVRVEAALCALDGVREAAVVGVEDPVRGDRAVAFLVADRWPLDLGALPAGLAPRELRRVEVLPATERGKLDRARLRRLAAEPAGAELEPGGPRAGTGR